MIRLDNHEKASRVKNKQQTTLHYIISDRPDQQKVCPLIIPTANPFEWRRVQEKKQHAERIGRFDPAFCRLSDVEWAKWMAERDCGGY